MGACGAKSTHQEVNPPLNERQARISQVTIIQNNQQQYSQFMRIDHPLNVNHKYTTFFKIIPEQFVGEGIRRTNKYSSRISREEWQAKRQEFWETRIEGKMECWGAIKMACDADEQNALAIIASAELKLVSKSIQILYDSQGMKYDVPVFCINEPIFFAEKPSMESNINKEFSVSELKVTLNNYIYTQIKVRSVTFPQDLETSIHNSTQVQELKQILMDSNKEKNIDKIRLFYNGRELQDHHQLGNYNLPNNTVFKQFYI